MPDYFNPKTGQIKWDVPPDAPVDWDVERPGIGFESTMANLLMTITVIGIPAIAVYALLNCGR